MEELDVMPELADDPEGWARWMISNEADYPLWQLVAVHASIGKT